MISTDCGVEIGPWDTGWEFVSGCMTFIWTPAFVLSLDSRSLQNVLPMLKHYRHLLHNVYTFT